MRCTNCGYIATRSPCSNCGESINTIAWAKWSDELHKDPNQIIRQQRAGEWASRPYEIDKLNNSAIFTGSGKSPYSTTLIDCTCGDYRKRKLPCKHMYRLAYELDIFYPDTIYTPYDVVRFDISNHSDDDMNDGFRIRGLDIDGKSAFINSYKVNLHECECDCFQSTGNVCSHIIHLAITLKVIGDPSKKGHLWK